MSGICNYYEKDLEERKYTKNEEQLFYAIMYRQWKSVKDIISSNKWKWADIKDQYFKDDKTLPTIKECFRLNLDFLKGPKNKKIYGEICEELFKQDVTDDNFTDNGDEDIYKELFEKDVTAVNSTDNGNEDIYTYDDIRKSVIDIFWEGNQPVLDLKYYEKQTLAARQVMKNGASIVLDEVGTGKTVAGIYTMQQVIQDKVDHSEDGRQASILIVCPYNKREDWHSDILRQLGRESRIINKSNNGEIIRQQGRNRKIPQIYISGNKGGDGADSDQELKKSFKDYRGKNWDLVIIDECHQCFDNYRDIKAERVLMLTATPIVVSGGKVRDFTQYRGEMESITGRKLQDKSIDPIGNQNPSEDDIFVCNFKEDIFKNIWIEREIKFEYCKRDDRRNEWFERLRSEKGFFTAIHADQDDNILASTMEKEFSKEGQAYSVTENHKLDKLKSIINDKIRDKKSCLIFCETIAAVDLIYNEISNWASDEVMIGKVYGEGAEIKNKVADKSNIMLKMKDHIRKDDKNVSVLITTGKTGGTGLNLGEFTTVIHYELPFSSNDLEQRFGRIERADDLINVDSDSNKVEKEMIFLINEPKEGEFDFITNRMLYYAINKINITYRYMPIRNTVLFHPKYMDRVKKDANLIWTDLKENLSKEDFLKKITDYFCYAGERDKVNAVLEELKEFYGKKFEGKGLVDKIDEILNNVAGDDIGKDKCRLLEEFKDKYLKRTTEFKELKELKEREEKIKNYIEYYLWLQKTLRFWEITAEDTEEDTVVNAAEDDFDKATRAEYEDQESDDAGKKENLFESSLETVMAKLKSDEKSISVIQDKVDKLLESIKDNKMENTYTGVFYYCKKDNSIVNKTWR